MTDPRPTAVTSCFDLQPMEKRLLMAAAPASPRSDTLGSLFDRGERQVLAARLTGFDAATRSGLASRAGSTSSFDAYLEGRMEGRPSHFFFDESDAANRAAYVKNNLQGLNDAARLDPVVADHKFYDGTGARQVDLPNNIDWTDGHPAGTTDPDFPNILNRHNEWLDLARASRYTGDAKYANELRYELASFSQQFYDLDVPADWDAVDKKGWTFTSALRAENWAWTYETMLGAPGWTATDQSLLLFKIAQQGDFLYAKADEGALDPASNRTMKLGKVLLELGQSFPELDAAADWERAGRDLVFRSMDAQLYADGSHVEQSTTYTAAALGDLMEARQIDKLNGDAGRWPAERLGRVDNAVGAYHQMLSPDGRQAAIGDSYRSPSAAVFLRASLILGDRGLPIARPRADDAWLLGPDAVNPYIAAPTYPAVGPRGTDYALPDGGNYVLRSADETRQVIFDAGPFGGIHGQHDLLSFELSSGSRPLIIDPGAYKYDSSPERAYAVSTRAHNTLNVDGLDTAELEGAGNAGLTINRYAPSANGTYVSATQRAYAHLPGSPVVTRGVWYDHDGAMLVVDFAESTTAHDYQQSFNLSAESDADVRSPESDGSFRTRYSSGDNVKVTPLTGGDVARGSMTFVTNRGEGDFKQDAWRFRVTKSGVQNAVLASLVTTYAGANPPLDVGATVLTRNPSPDEPLVIRVTRGGRSTDVTFAPPALERIDPQTNGIDGGRAGASDVEYGPDGTLHFAYEERAAGALMYATRSPAGVWTVPQAIDRGQLLGEYMDLKLDNAGRPGIAYFDGWNGDLKYAHLDAATNAWEPETLDSRGSVGLYPSLAFSRNGSGAPAITYYDRRIGALKMQQFQGTDGWDVTTLHYTEGGDAGRFSQLLLDPNRPDSTKYAIGYEDTRDGIFRYMIQHRDGWREQVIDADMAGAGGYLSLQFYDSARPSSEGDRYLPAASYYDVTPRVGTATKFAYYDGDEWRAEYVDLGRKRGLYSQLFFDGSGPDARATVFYFDRARDLALKATRPLNGRWTYGVLADGGRELHVARKPGELAYTNLDETAGEVDVTFVR